MSENTPGPVGSGRGCLALLFGVGAGPTRPSGTSVGRAHPEEFTEEDEGNIRSGLGGYHGGSASGGYGNYGQGFDHSDEYGHDDHD